jgi:hypothetical protein
MTKKEFYALVPDYCPEDCHRLSSGGTPLSKDKQKWLNNLVAEVRVLRTVYDSDPLIKVVCTNILAGAILVDCE